MVQWKNVNMSSRNRAEDVVRCLELFLDARAQHMALGSPAEQYAECKERLIMALAYGFAGTVFEDDE